MTSRLLPLLASMSVFYLGQSVFPGLVNYQCKSVALISSHSYRYIQTYRFESPSWEFHTLFVSLCEIDNKATPLGTSTRPGFRILLKLIQHPRKSNNASWAKGGRYIGEKSIPTFGNF